MSSGKVETRKVDWDDPQDRFALVMLLDSYARDPMGMGRPLDEEVKQRLPADLSRRADCVCLLAFVDDQPAGIALCFEGYSSFRARPLLNIHDFAVHPEHRGQGVGRALMEAVDREAIERGCCRITLEVRADNHIARALYRKCGYDPGESDGDAMSFWTKTIE